METTNLAVALNTAKTGITEGQASAIDNIPAGLLTKLDKSGGTITGNLAVTGAIKGQTITDINNAIANISSDDNKLDKTGGIISGALQINTPLLQARYIRFQRVTNLDYINLNEIEVYRTNGVQLNNSTWTVAMSSVYVEDGVPLTGNRMIDENYGTFSHTIGTGVSEFIEVDMKALQTFSYFILYNRAGAPVLINRAIGLTVILKNNAGIEINTSLLSEDNGAYGQVSGSTSRVITTGNDTYTFRNVPSLDVNGSANISGQLTAGPAYMGLLINNGNDFAQFSHTSFKNSLEGYAILQDLNGSTYINSKSNQPIRFRNDNEERMILASNGIFGIGTTNPTAKLQIETPQTLVANDNPYIRLMPSRSTGE